MHDSHLFIHGTDFEGYERALRLLPFRTGVPNPEWLIVGEAEDSWSWGGILGAGYVILPPLCCIRLMVRVCRFWDREGEWSESMSFMR